MSLTHEGNGPPILIENSLAQMLRQNGGCRVVVAAPEGLKMELAKKLDAGDVRFPYCGKATH